MAEVGEIYTIGQVLGQGAFGIVHLVHHKSTSQDYACKIIKKRIGATSAYEQQEREVSIMKTLKHPNIVLLNAVYECPKHVAMVMELCDGGEVVQLVRQRGFCPDETIRVIINQLTDAVAYLHRNRVIHRDIKPENILIKLGGTDKDLQIKMADFGLACYTDSIYQVDNIAGTPMYMAPEIVQKLGYNHSCDIWSIGVMFYLLLCNYNKGAEAELHDMIKNGEISYPASLWDAIDAKAKSLCELILRFDPAKRISAGEILSHPWITQTESTQTVSSNNVLDLMKSYNAERRLRKAIMLVHAAVRFRKGIKPLPPTAEEKDTASEMELCPLVKTKLAVESHGTVLRKSKVSALTAPESNSISGKTQKPHVPKAQPHPAAARPSPKA
ncbi:Serine/threonine-protein kinase 33 [Kappamyces sp. JEL0680]|nr:Serine/threonine-protein kinase 33 [Kappamyces sp. JEL0680]